MAVLSAKAAGKDGRVAWDTPAAGGDSFSVVPHATVFRARNTGPAAITLTFPAVFADSHKVTHDLAVSVPNDGDIVEVGLFAANRWGNLVSVAYSSVTGLQVAVVAFGDLSGLE